MADRPDLAPPPPTPREWSDRDEGNPRDLVGGLGDTNALRTDGRGPAMAAAHDSVWVPLAPNHPPMLRPTILDHRGRRVPLLPAEFRLPSSAHAARLNAASNLPRPPVTRQEVWRGIGLGLLALPLMLIGALSPSALTFGLKAPWWASILAAIPLGAAPAIITIFLIRRIAHERIALTYTAASFCASCGYDLLSLPTEPDGCRVCPECSAAWRPPADHAVTTARAQPDRPTA